MPFFQTDQAQFHYYQFGNGPDVMLAFHGFGMKGTQFDVLQPAFAERYTVYSFDLFFHGQTRLTDPTIKKVRKGLSSVEYARQISAFLDEKGIGKVSVLSYSMGALMAFSLIEHIPERIGNTFFIAPDGIRPNKLLQFGSRNLLVNRIFYKLVYSPATVDFILGQLLRFRYIDKGLHRILKGEFHTEETRLTCYQAITYHARMRFRPDILARQFNSHGIRSYFYFGEQDKLFPPAIGREFCRKLQHGELAVLPTGHELVNAGLNNLIIEQLREKKND